MRSLPRTFQLVAGMAMFVGVGTAAQFPTELPHLPTANGESMTRFVAWSAVLLLCFAVRAAMASKVVLANRLISALLAITLGFTTAFTVANELQHQFGPASAFTTPNRDELDYSGAAGLSSEIFFIFGIFFSKISICAVLMALAPTKKHRLPTLAVEITVLVWTISSLYSVIKNHKSERASEQSTFWHGYARIDVLTDIAIMLSPINLVRNLQLPLEKKANICLAFSFRSLAIGCTLVRISTTYRDKFHGGDPSSGSWMFALSVILQLFVGTLAACVPHLSPFRESVQAACLLNEKMESERREKQVTNGDADGRVSRSNAVEFLKSDTMKSRGNSPRP